MLRIGNEAMTPLAIVVALKAQRSIIVFVVIGQVLDIGAQIAIDPNRLLKKALEGGNERVVIHNGRKQLVHAAAGPTVVTMMMMIPVVAVGTAIMMMRLLVC